MAFDWKSIVKTVAPVLGTALGGPMAGAATKFIADKFLGNLEATEPEIAEALNNASPDQLIKLKELDNAFALQMRQLDVDIYNIDAQDRDSARKANVANNKLSDEVIKGYLVIALSAIVFICIHALVKQDINGVEANIVSAILGSAFTALLSMVNFYWGTSKSSIDKDSFMMAAK